jgi:hypothetical protein
MRQWGVVRDVNNESAVKHILDRVHYIYEVSQVCFEEWTPLIGQPFIVLK